MNSPHYLANPENPRPEMRRTLTVIVTHPNYSGKGHATLLLDQGLNFLRARQHHFIIDGLTESGLKLFRSFLSAGKISLIKHIDGKKYLIGIDP